MQDIARADMLVTVLGGSGFVGRQVVEALTEAGVRVRVAARDTGRAMRVKPFGVLGQKQLIATDITRPESIARALMGADAVINLVGVFGRASLAINAAGARKVAEAARVAGAKALVHVSAIGADAHSASLYGRSKGLGEAHVRETFPGATIIRPSIIFGREDNFVNRFARLIRAAPVAVPVVSPATRFQPVHVGDVAEAIAAAALDPARHGASIYELGGPEVMTMRELIGFIARETGRERWLVDVPPMVAKALALGTGWAPGAPITHDQLKMLGRDNVVSEGATGFEAFGMRPVPLAAVTPGWLDMYRRFGRFAQPGEPA